MPQPCFPHFYFPSFLVCMFATASPGGFVFHMKFKIAYFPRTPQALPCIRRESSTSQKFYKQQS